MAQGPGQRGGDSAARRSQSSSSRPPPQPLGQELGHRPPRPAPSKRGLSASAVAPVWRGRCQPTGTPEITERQAAVRTMET